MMTKSYSELLKIKSFKERMEYLRLESVIGEPTFGGHRFLNQKFYKSADWERIRRKIILRDDGYDLAHSDFPINGPVYIHHINPITIEDILSMRPCVYDPENLVSVSFSVHNYIHYGTKDIGFIEPVTRQPNDTCPWR